MNVLLLNIIIKKNVVLKTYSKNSFSLFLDNKIMEYENTILKMEREFLRQQAINQQNTIEQLIRQGDMLYKTIDELKSEIEALKKDNDLKMKKLLHCKKIIWCCYKIKQVSFFIYLFVFLFLFLNLR
jgi:hypothetical protein